MFIGFDYGTSNCAISVMDQGDAKLLPVHGDSCFIPSTLYALDRTLIVDAVLQNMPQDTALSTSFSEQRTQALNVARNTKKHLGIRDDEQTWFMGNEAIENYIDYPGEGWFVKSPKSFLGASGLLQGQVAFFEDIVTLMMQHTKRSAEAHAGATFTQAVIGRPINFQGVGGEQSNQQAIEILTRAAKNAGYREVEFFYEPLAAGIDFETGLQEDKTVLVLDVGGGTSDCSIVRMGPSYRDCDDRSKDFIAHSGVRVGGNDFDIDLNYKAFMPLLGRDSFLKNGLPVPSSYYANAAKINDIVAQGDFGSAKCAKEIVDLIRNAKSPELIRRLQTLQKNNQNYQLSRSAEQCKIALSEQAIHAVDLGYLEPGLTREVSASYFEQAVERPLRAVTDLLEEAIKQAGCKIDLLYVTGGSAKSPVLRRVIEEKFKGVPIVDGDYLGSVAAGLAKWADKIFR